MTEIKGRKRREKQNKHIDFSMKPTDYEKIRFIAGEYGQPVNGFLNTLISEEIDRWEKENGALEVSENNGNKPSSYPRKVYAIQHNETGRIYVGSTCNIEQRMRAHILSLRNRKHTNKEMQSDFNRHGENYSFFTLDDIVDSSEDEKEFEWMDKLNTTDVKSGYNTNDPHFRRKKEIAIKITDGEPIPNNEKYE